MNVDLFEGCWARWERANDHRQEMAKVWNEFLEDHPFDFFLDHRGGGEFILRVDQARPVPASFAVLLGEWLYNLRGALDYIVWATVAHQHGVVPPPGEGALQYPIYEGRTQWDRNRYRLNGLAPHHRDMLFVMQPFNSDPDANYLGWLNSLARVDRHRRLNIATAYLAVVEPVFKMPEAQGRSTSLQWGQRVLVNGRAEVARLVVRPWDDTIGDHQVQVNPRIGIDPEIEAWAQSPFWRRIRFSERLTMIQTFIEAEIAAYEYDCTGHSRKEELLKVEFRSTCDSRRPALPPLRLPSIEVAWSDPESGRPSTTARFHGVDFPSSS